MSAREARRRAPPRVRPRSARGGRARLRQAGKRAAWLLLWLWQLPQNGLGLLASLAVAAMPAGAASLRIERRPEGRVSYCLSRFGGVSLGRYLFVHRQADERLVRHELGHSRQSLLLGPAYLLVIGLPSLAWALLHPTLRRIRPGVSYFSFPTERWADRLGGTAGPDRLA